MISTLTIRLPEEKHTRLREIARQRGLSFNRLMDELSTIALVDYDTGNALSCTCRASIAQGWGTYPRQTGPTP